MPGFGGFSDLKIFISGIEDFLAIANFYPEYQVFLRSRDFFPENFSDLEIFR